MQPEAQIIDLLEWARDHGIKPRTEKPKDLFLEPFSKRLMFRKDLKPHQRRYALYIPGRRTLRDLGMRTESVKMHSCVLLRGGPLTGAGVGEHEAALSLVNQMRLALAH